MPVRTLLGLLIAVPPGIFVSHAVTYRASRALDRRPTAHSSALAAIVAWFAVTVAIAAATVWPADAAPLSKACALAYVVATYGALAILYLDAVNIAETSLHMHVLLEVTWSRHPSLARLLERYSAERMIGERLERLMALGQIRLSNGRYHLVNRSTLRLNRAIDFWRTVLGLPTSLDQVHAP